MIDFNYIVKIHKKLITRKINEVLTLDEIIEKFKYHLEGENIRFSVYIDLRDSFLIQYKLTNNKTYKEIYENLYFILSNFKFEDNFNDDKESFSVAYNYCIYAKEKNLFKPTHLHISAKVKCLIESLTFFKSKGINNLFNNGSVNFKKIIEIENIIDKKFKDIGIDSIPAIFSMIPKLKKTKFYSFINEHETQIYPWGYILNKALRYTKPLNLTSNVRSIRLTSVLEFSKHYISLYQYQNYEYSHFQYMYSSGESILKLIDKHVIGDQLLKIEQYDSKSILEYLKFIKNRHPTPELNLTLDLANFIYSKDHNKIVDITEEIETIYKRYSFDVVNKISRLVTHKSINKNFHTIYDLNKADYKKKPFVQVNDRLFFLNHSFFFIGFYYVFLELLYQIDVKSNEQGVLLEDFAGHSLTTTPLQFIGNNKYKVNASQRSVMGIAAQSLELDLAIHNNKNIALFEIKNRVLTDPSKGGHGYYILNDLAESLIKSQTQLNKHKRFLLNFKEINFNGKQKINLENRTIYKITVSSLDYQSLHNPLIVESFLRSLPFFTLKSSNDSLIDSLVKNINEKIMAFSDEILKPETKKEIEEPMGLHNSFFINIFHFLFLIEQAKTKGTDFIDELTLYHNTILNQLDFYYCYFYKNNHFNS
ncbi:hypothetical protein [Acinetobacter pittii]|uniref:hypothetical protein n=1 Tax=Acinetobacter pittii TaxID=48296 RepID=UPI00197D9918|nr:hypothetical protein [Acinetobacter pittii]MBN6492805.1 hypothetical protein [Acinetobacter pittii]